MCPAGIIDCDVQIRGGDDGAGGQGACAESWCPVIPALHLWDRWTHTHRGDVGLAGFLQAAGTQTWLME